MKNKITETDLENVIDAEIDIDSAFSNFTKTFLNIAKTCIPTREVTIRSDDKVWFDSDLRMNRVNATDYGKYFLGRKRKQPKNNLKHKETNLIT